MPEVKRKQPERAALPITSGKEPQWDLSKVDTDSLIAELIRRGQLPKPAVRVKK